MKTDISLAFQGLIGSRPLEEINSFFAQSASRNEAVNKTHGISSSLKYVLAGFDSLKSSIQIRSVQDIVIYFSIS